jgi:hypothetical protein
MAHPQIRMRLPQRIRDRKRGAQRHRFMDRLLQPATSALAFGGKTPDEVYATAEIMEQLAA